MAGSMAALQWLPSWPSTVRPDIGTPAKKVTFAYFVDYVFVGTHTVYLYACGFNLPDAGNNANASYNAFPQDG